MNNELEQFSEERLKEMVKFCEPSIHGLSKHFEPQEVAALARIALAAKQAKPFCYVSTECIKQNVDVGVGVGGGTWAMSQKPYNGGRGFDLVNPLYTTPQPAHTEQDGWIKCSERMPSKGQCVSISDGHLVGVWRYRGWWPDFDGNGCASTSDPLHLIKNISHWMPLPAAPKPESE